MRKAALAAAYLLSAGTILPLIRRESWWIRIFDFPRPQITFGLLAATVALLGDKNKLKSSEKSALAVALTSGLYQLWEMSGYTPVRPVQSLRAQSTDAERRVELLIANVLQTNHDVEEYAALIDEYDPDLVIIAEGSSYWESSLRGIERRYPHTIKCPLDNTYGLLLYSRLPLVEPKILFRVHDDVPSFVAQVELRTGDRFLLHVLHPRPPHIGVDTAARDAELILVAKEVKDVNLPVIVTGDLNDVAWSHTTRLFLRISGLLDPRLGRTFCNTFHSHIPIFRWPLDHLFHSRAFRLVNFQRGPKTASDHFPVIVTLSYEPEVRHQQERPVPEAEDHEEANRKIQAGLSGAG